MKKRLTSKLFFLVLLGAIGFGIYKYVVPMFSGNQTYQIIRAVKTKRGNLTTKVTATGEVKPYNRVEIKPAIAGRIEEVLVQEGDQIKKGQVLAWMSSAERAALLDAAQSQGPEVFKKWQEVYKTAPLTSPLDGMLIVRAVEPGQTVTTADPVVVIADRLIVKALVDETDLAQIELGQKTEIQLDAYQNEKFDGKVDHISYESTLTNNVNVYTIDVVLQEIPPTFRSGMTANVTFIISEKNNTLTLPSEAITDWPKEFPRPKEAEFAVFEKGFGGKLVPVAIQIGDTDGRSTEITDGLKEGDEVFIVRKKQSTSKSPFSQQKPQSQGQRKPQAS